MGKTKTWKNGGEEDAFIERLISEGSFSKNTKASTMKQKYPSMFGGFNENVIRNHMNELKRRNGLYLHETGAGGLSDVEEGDDDGPQNVEHSTNASKVAKIDDSGVSKQPQQSITLNHHNYPFVCETYKDPITQMDILLVVFNVPGGAQNVKIELNSDGTAVTVKYNWAKAMYNIDDLFQKMVAAREFTMIHPKVLVMQNALEKCRDRIDVAPESTITMKLPIKVQTGAETWKKSGIVRQDGMQVVMGEFMGYVKDYHKKNVDCCVVFDK